MRKKIEEIIEQSFEVVRIGNKVYYTSKSESDEKFKRRIEELLTLTDVVASLPKKKKKKKKETVWDVKTRIAERNIHKLR